MAYLNHGSIFGERSRTAELAERLDSGLRWNDDEERMKAGRHPHRPLRHSDSPVPATPQPPPAVIPAKAGIRKGEAGG